VVLRTSRLPEAAHGRRNPTRLCSRRLPTYRASVNRPRPELERALAFVAEHLEAPLTAADVARVACMSEFHFQRVFHEALGESIGRFTTRKRLERAALRLAYERESSITNIALSSGYSSSSNFSKAFTAYFGCSPSDVRNPGGVLPDQVGKITALYGKDFRPQALYTIPNAPDADAVKRQAAHWDRRVRFVDSPGLRFACLSSQEGYEFSTLEATWSELITRCRQLGICGDDVDAWGMAFDSPDLTAPERCRYHACVPCPSPTALPEPLFAGELEAGRYAVFEYEGAVGDVGAAYRSIYSCWFRHSSVAPEDFQPVEHYVSDAPRGGHVAMEMWLRVRARER